MKKQSTHIGAALTSQQRRDAGQALRKGLHRQDHAKWTDKMRKTGPDGDPLALLARSVKGRVPTLVALKYERMLASPFGFYRGAVPVMAADLALLPHTGIENQLCGDAHVRNLGAYAGVDGRLVFDINDFDETIRGPFEWDLKRMATSLVLAGREAKVRDSGCQDAVLAFAERYRGYVRGFSQIAVVEAARFQVHRLHDVQPVSDALLQARRAVPKVSLKQLTVKDSRAKHRIFRKEPPLLYRVRGAKAQQVLDSLRAYRATLLPERRHFLDQYRPLDVGFKVVGTGSVGLRDYVVYLEGNGPGDPLFLQIKEETPSAYAPYLKEAKPAHEGQRVAEGQRAMQLQSDPFLGWTRIENRDYLVRQLNDHKGSINVNDLKGSGLIEYAELCGELLARGHTRSGDACMLSGYLGNSARFDDALMNFATAYADQTERDWLRLKKARS